MQTIENQSTEWKESSIINAVVHKNYGAYTPIAIKVYDDKIIMYNDAALPDGWTIDNFTTEHKSMPQNPFIASTFFRSGSIESWGRGIEKIENGCKETGAKLSYKYDGSSVATIFTFKNKMPRSADWNDHVNDHVKLSQTARLVLQEIKKDATVDYKVIESTLEISTATVRRAIKELKDKNIIKRIGSDKTGHWEVQNEN